MILKPPQKTKSLLQLEILQDRYLEVPPDIVDAFGRELAGYLGEKSLPYYMNLTSLHSHYDLYNLRLEHNRHHFQMDGLFLFSNFLLIIEVKHLIGKIMLNDAHQLIQSKDTEEKVYDNPIMQAALQKEQLHSLLSKSGYHSIPIHTLVVFTHKKVNLSIDHPDIITSQLLPFRLKKLSKDFPNHILTMDQLLTLGKELLALHSEKNLNLLQDTHIDLRNIRRGVFCPKCKPIVMKRRHGGWVCPNCNYKNRDCHIYALIDFIYLFGEFITNRQLRWFLLIDSEYTATRILKDLGLKAEGNTKNRRYNLLPLLKFQR
ncbi:nuclease-related domain-containing protein [Gracilibacillus thailandensis]|uniref:nuclease-related domain-containing protein n=1 Tax=Gracilibacillus thailandensis TaxID=563735 RepID=UPI0013D49D8A|nr:nuclease-related domain-containing protein [Gracilibacillus thailandensis]